MGVDAVSSGVKCWICGGEAPVDEDYRSVSLHRCADCGFLFAPERSPEQLEELYSDEYFEDFHGTGSYADEAVQRRFEAEHRIDWVTKYRSSGRLLEIGAANGVFLDAARKVGFEVTGVEPAPGYAAKAREEFDIDVRAGFIESVDLPDEPFDVICAFHVLEHLNDPRIGLQRLRDHIADDGVMLLEIPNIESLRAIKHRTNWVHLDPKNHVGFYTPEQLATLLGQCGFELAEHHTIAPITYQRPRQAMRPVSLALRAYDTLTTRRLQSRPDPSKHEFIRAVVKPSSSPDRP